MATYIKDLKEDNGDIVYPHTNTDAVYTSTNETLETLISKYVTSEDIAQSVASFGTVTGGMIDDNTISTAKIIKSSFIDMFYPVGSYYETSDTSFNPNTAWGGTWVEDSAGRVTVSQNSGTFATVGNTGGAETHTLTVNEMPSHNHTSKGWAAVSDGSGSYITLGGAGASTDYSTNYRGSGQAHNNLQPYIVVKRWHRTA